MIFFTINNEFAAAGIKQQSTVPRRFELAFMEQKQRVFLTYHRMFMNA
ncbi:Uncharacterised protein [Vibrio cholerae]|nr:Uncharacterised protein [Vibrio cholerae]CSC79735.1 Uncharacterised protein [Vibrio cholerae]